MAVKRLEPIAGSKSADVTIRRGGRALAATVNTVLASCDVVDIREFTTVAVKPSAGITTLDVYASDVEDGTFVLVNDIGTAGVFTVVASKWQALTAAAIAPHNFLKFVPNTNGTVDVVGKS